MNRILVALVAVLGLICTPIEAASKEEEGVAIIHIIDNSSSFSQEDSILISLGVGSSTGLLAMQRRPLAVGFLLFGATTRPLVGTEFRMISDPSEAWQAFLAFTPSGYEPRSNIAEALIRAVEMGEGSGYEETIIIVHSDGLVTDAPDAALDARERILGSGARLIVVDLDGQGMEGWLGVLAADSGGFTVDGTAGNAQLLQLIFRAVGEGLRLKKVLLRRGHARFTIPSGTSEFVTLTVPDESIDEDAEITILPESLRASGSPWQMNDRGSGRLLWDLRRIRGSRSSRSLDAELAIGSGAKPITGIVIIFFRTPPADEFDVECSPSVENWYYSPSEGATCRLIPPAGVIPTSVSVQIRVGGQTRPVRVESDFRFHMPFDMAGVNGSVDILVQLGPDVEFTITIPFEIRSGACEVLSVPGQIRLVAEIGASPDGFLASEWLDLELSPGGASDRCRYAALSIGIKEGGRFRLSGGTIMPISEPVVRPVTPDGGPGEPADRTNLPIHGQARVRLDFLLDQEMAMRGGVRLPERGGRFEVSGTVVLGGRGVTPCEIPVVIVLVASPPRVEVTTICRPFWRLRTVRCPVKISSPGKVGLRVDVAKGMAQAGRKIFDVRLVDERGDPFETEGGDWTWIDPDIDGEARAWLEYAPVMVHIKQAEQWEFPVILHWFDPATLMEGSELAGTRVPPLQMLTAARLGSGLMFALLVFGGVHRLIRAIRFRRERTGSTLGAPGTRAALVGGSPGSEVHLSRLPPAAACFLPGPRLRGYGQVPVMVNDRPVTSVRGASIRAGDAVTLGDYVLRVVAVGPRLVLRITRSPIRTTVAGALRLLALAAVGSIIIDMALLSEGMAGLVEGLPWLGLAWPF